MEIFHIKEMEKDSEGFGDEGEELTLGNVRDQE